ncbi:MAG: glycosyltransferase family 2 protein [Candidatus Electrothrix sp. GW3-4]|uniref:glycosyltransferase family 2 protein n=1 Tax=Candidatus Electrothrix sp. GW3-4 TaxID=3126740 RepID=UPI0030CCA1F3
MKPVVSVLTPTWDRACYLPNVWEGLTAQTYRNFEWIVANDGSADNTIKIVYELAAKSNFPVTLINASCRIGKSTMDNEAVAAARGDFIIWCDSDDVFLPHALETLYNSWESIPSEERGAFCGITALCDTENGVLGRKFYTSENAIDLTWNDLYNKLNSDLVIFTRAELLKSNPFVEVDFLIPESSVWSIIGTRKTRFIPRVLERKHYGEKNCLSFSGVMAYNRGNAYAMAMSRETSATLLNRKELLLRAINYLRYCWHGDIPLRKAISLWQVHGVDVWLLLTVWPLSELLALKDRLQGKVRKTHLEFIAAQVKVEIDVKRLNFDA